MRMSKDQYYIGIAKAASKRSTCIRRQYGAVIVKDDVIIATGYNGSPRGAKNCCDEGFCWREEHNIPHGEQYEKCQAIHAEDNAISQAGRKAIGGTLYLAGYELGRPISAAPCLMCRRKIQNAQLDRLVLGIVEDGEERIEVENLKHEREVNLLAQENNSLRDRIENLELEVKMLKGDK